MKDAFNHMTPVSALMSIREASLVLNVSRHTVYRMVKDGTLTLCKLRGVSRLYRREIDAIARWSHNDLCHNEDQRGLDQRSNGLTDVGQLESDGKTSEATSTNPQPSTDLPRQKPSRSSSGGYKRVSVYQAPKR